MSYGTVIVYPTAADVAVAAGARLLLAIGDAAAKSDQVHICLTGGTVGIELLRQAAKNPLVATVDWSSVHLWWGDERFVAIDSSDRNAVGAIEGLLSLVPVPEENIHQAPALDGEASPEKLAAAAQAYAGELAKFGTQDQPYPNFAVTLLGMGPDGHVASLFPGRDELALTSPAVVGIDDSPKPPPQRVSLTRPVINASEQVWLVVAGAEKAPALSTALASQGTEPSAEQIAAGLLPAATVSGRQATLWLVDAAAAGQGAGA